MDKQERKKLFERLDSIAGIEFDGKAEQMKRVLFEVRGLRNELNDSYGDEGIIQGSDLEKWKKLWGRNQ